MQSSLQVSKMIWFFEPHQVILSQEVMIFLMAFWQSSCKSKSSLQFFKPFYHHFSSLPFHLPAALLGQITRVYFHQFKVMLDTAKRWKIDKYSNNTSKMRRSKFSTVSLVLYNLTPAFQLCFHISTFQDNKKVTKSSRLRIPWSTQNWNLESKFTCWLQLTQNSHISNLRRKGNWIMKSFAMENASKIRHSERVNATTLKNQSSISWIACKSQSCSFSEEFKIQHKSNSP